MSSAAAIPADIAIGGAAEGALGSTGVGLTLIGLQLEYLFLKWMYAGTRAQPNSATNSNTSKNERGSGKWRCVAKAALIDLQTNSAVGYITGIGYGPTQTIAAQIAKRNVANSTPQGFRTKHSKPRCEKIR